LNTCNFTRFVYSIFFFFFFLQDFFLLIFNLLSHFSCGQVLGSKDPSSSSSSGRNGRGVGFEGSDVPNSAAGAEHWYDEDIDRRGKVIRGGDSYAPSGSVGDWLIKSACPAEVKNFKKLIACLERFERESGMRLNMKPNGEGFDIPLGPDLACSMSFHFQS